MNPKPHIQPKSSRPPRKAVTFIVGLSCSNGVVLCSDSLEADGYNKKIVKKIFKYEVEGSWGLAFGCSGTGAACTNFTDRLLELLDDKEAYDRRGTEKLIEATMSYMRGQYPNETLDVVIGLWSLSPAETRIYRAQTNTQCLSVESDYVCVGLDVSLARFLLDSIFVGASNANVKDGSYIAAFVTSVMKDKADGVGGPTQILHYRVGMPKWCDLSPSINKIEEGGFIEGKFTIAHFEKAIRQFCWSRFPHEFTPADD
jgi:20S proteasome alpha/beta subunit